MLNCTPLQLEFPGIKHRKGQANFSGGYVSNNAGGYLLLRQADVVRTWLFSQ